MRLHLTCGYLLGRRLGIKMARSRLRDSGVAAVVITRRLSDDRMYLARRLFAVCGKPLGWVEESARVTSSACRWCPDRAGRVAVPVRQAAPRPASSLCASGRAARDAAHLVVRGIRAGTIRCSKEPATSSRKMPEKNLARSSRTSSGRPDTATALLGKRSSRCWQPSAWRSFRGSALCRFSQAASAETCSAASCPSARTPYQSGSGGLSGRSAPSPGTSGTTSSLGSKLPSAATAASS